MDMSAASGEGLKLAGSMQFGAWIGGGALDWLWWSAPFDHFQPRVELECFYHDTIAWFILLPLRRVVDRALKQKQPSLSAKQCLPTIRSLMELGSCYCSLAKVPTTITAVDIETEAWPRLM